MSALLPQPLHAVALHGFAKSRYAIKRSPFAGCWCSGCLDVPRPPHSAVKALSAAPVVVCGGIQHNGVLCKAHAPVKNSALRVRIRGRYVLRPSGKCRHKIKINVHHLQRGAAKRGWCFVAPPTFAAWSAAPVYLACLSVVAARSVYCPRPPSMSG